MRSKKAAPPNARRRKAGWDAFVSINRLELARLIRVRGMSQSEVARKARLAKQTLSYVLQGRNKRMREGDRARLAKALGVSVDAISDDAPMTNEQLARAIEHEPIEEARMRWTIPLSPRSILEGLAAEETLQATSLATPEVSQQVRKLFLLPYWRGLLEAPAKYNEKGGGDSSESAEFARAMGIAFRTLLRPWRERDAQLPAASAERLAVLWRALYSLRLAVWRPGPENIAALDAAEAAVVALFARARADANATLAAGVTWNTIGEKQGSVPHRRTRRS